MTPPLRFSKSAVPIRPPMIEKMKSRKPRTNWLMMMGTIESLALISSWRRIISACAGSMFSARSSNRFLIVGPIA